MSTKLIECKVLVNLLAVSWIIVPLHALILTKESQNSICEIISRSELPGPQNYSCSTLLDDRLSNNSQNFRLSLFCKSDDIFGLRLHGTLKNLSYYIIEKKEYGMEWEFVKHGKIPEHSIYNVKNLKNNTRYDVRIIIIQIAKLSTYQSVATGWLKTAPADKTPLPVQNVNSLYISNGNSSSIIVEWSPAEDLSCYYFVKYQTTTREHNDYYYIEEPHNLFKTIIENIAYNQTYHISIKATNAEGNLESIPKEVSVVTPACLNVHHTLALCAPDMPEDLKVEEIPNSSSLSNYDLKMSWSLPKYIPDYYQVRFASLAENSTLDFNISGVQTVALIKKVKIFSYYHVILTAWSAGGKSKDVVYLGHVTVDSNTTSAVPVVWISIGSLLVIGLCVIVAIVINRKVESKRKTDKRNIYLKELEHKCITTETPKGCQYEMRNQFVDEWVIDSRGITLHNILGEGAFGVVRYGKFTREKAETEVAVKTLRSSPSREELGHFQHELETLKAVGRHPHLERNWGIFNTSWKH
ncbi:Fibronectin type III domain [Popillia japonica]|uniref:Fibronectin type III domain n=1 Tax=Popillia japonica TaxID=7064 RepID=A0AAW1MCI7_POPJA